MHRAMTEHKERRPWRYRYGNAALFAFLTVLAWLAVIGAATTLRTLASWISP